MKKLIISLFLLLTLTGCVSKVDKDVRLTGIIDACYTAVEYNQKEDVKLYLDNKVKNGEICETTAQAIIKCIERGNKK